MLAMRLISRIVSLLTILAEVEDLRPTFLVVDDLGDEVPPRKRFILK
jgi:hypothetical protein